MFLIFWKTDEKGIPRRETDAAMKEIKPSHQDIKKVDIT